MGTAEKEIIKKIEDRASVGLQKYGVTTDRDDLTLKDWVIHLQEELLDAAVYSQKIIQLINKLDKLE